MEANGPSDYLEVSTDLLSIRGYENYKAKDFHMEFLFEDQHYFIVSPKDVIVGKPRDMDDHLEWLIGKKKKKKKKRERESVTDQFLFLDHELFQEALEDAEKNSKSLRHFSIVSVGRKYLDHLLSEGSYETAGNLCPRILGRSKKLWQEEAREKVEGSLRLCFIHVSSFRLSGIQVCSDQPTSEIGRLLSHGRRLPVRPPDLRDGTL